MRPTVSLLLVLPLLIWGQQPPPTPANEPGQEPTIKVDVDLVNVLFTVRTKNGGLVSNLTKDDFVVREDGQQQQIRYFTRETNLPLTMGLLIDVSPSQGSLIETERRAAAAFFPAVVQKQDQAFVISFGREAELLQDLTNSHTLLQRSLNGLQVNADVGGLHPGPVPTISHPKGTVLFDAVYLAANDMLKKEVGRKAMVLITDGEDSGSTYKIHEAIAAAQRADVIVYGIYYVDHDFYRRNGSFMGVSDGDLKRMSEETGGRVFRVDRNHSLSDIFREIQLEMRSQYSITYAPTNQNKDGGFRRLEIKANQKEYKVQSRKGYYASGGA